MSSGYGSGQRMPSQQTYEAPACVQNAMMTKDKKPFTYTPGGIDLSQIKSERMAKRLARNAQAEGATGHQQHNRPTQPQSPGSPSACASMGAAAMGMPFQVLPPPPPPQAPGKNLNGGSAPAPPPPPPSSSNLLSNNTGTLAPPANGGRGSAPNSPSMARKSPTPQRFEPPPMGFRPEIKIPSNPMAALRKVPPPVEKNTFWKDEYAKERSKSPMVDAPASNNSSVNNNTTSEQNDSVDSTGSSPQTQTNASNGTTADNNGETNVDTSNCDNIDGLRKSMPTTNTTNNNINNLQQNQTINNNTNNQPPPQQQQQQQNNTTATPPPQQQSPIKLMQQNGGVSAQQAPQQAPQQQQEQQQQQSPRSEFRSVAPPQSPAVNVYTRQTDSPRTMENATPPRATESPFKFAQQQQQLQQLQQQRAPPAVSPLAQLSTPSSASSGASVSPNSPAQSVPWRTQQRGPQPQEQQPQSQSHPQPIYNNVKPKSPDFSTQTSAYQGPKPTNVGSLYIAPLAPPTEPQAQHIVRQQMQQQQQQRDSPMRQMAPQQQQQPQQNQGAPGQQLRWMSSQPMSKEQPAWVRPEENGNVIPSSLNRMAKSPQPPIAMQQTMQQQPMQQQPLQQQPYQQPQQMYQPLNQGNGFMQQTSPQNFGAQPITSTGLRLQINAQANPSTQNGPRERIIPITLEATPTYTPVQPSFNNQQQYGGGNICNINIIPATPSKLNQQRSLFTNNDNSQQYIPPSEQHVPEPKKYTGSAIPSRSFKILQAMTQPENADEQENSLDQNNVMNAIETKPKTNRNSYTSNSSTEEPVSSSCSTTSLNSDSLYSSSPSPTPPPTQPMAYPAAYPYPYGYPWYPPPPPPMPQQNGDNANPPNWPYPYGLPHQQPNFSETGDNSHYPPSPYPYYYPYYSPTPFPPQNMPQSDGQNPPDNYQNFYPYMPPPPPYLAYPYPVAPSYSQSSNSSRASSVLPDIIITPSTDDVPSKVILNHHINVAKKEERPKRSGSIEIEDVSSLKSNQIKHGAVVDILTQHLENMSHSMENNLNLKRQMKKSYIKNFSQKSPEDNTSPVQITMVMTESEQDSDSESSDSEVTPKQADRNNKKGGPVPLQSIKSVNNLQIYHAHKLREEPEESEDDDDETTADNESDIFDEEEEDDQATDIEQNDSECEEFVIEDDLSVIYEEESDYDKSSDLAKTVIRGDRSSHSGELSLGKDEAHDDLDTKIEENDDNDDEDDEEYERDDSTSVTVRLPLKFSFSSLNNEDNIGTVEVGTSQIREKRNSITSIEQRNSFSVAAVESDSEDGDEDNEDCEVSVTISLSPSVSRSSSIDRKVEYKNMAEIKPIEDMPEEDSSQEDNSVSFSLNMRNKFANETINGDLSKNPAIVEPVKESKKVESKQASDVPEEFDFFATLMATKKQAQIVKEQSANYWGKSMEKKEIKDENTAETTITENQEIEKEKSNETTVNKASFWDTCSSEENKHEHKIEPQENEKATVNKTSFWETYSAKTKAEVPSEHIKESKTSFWDADTAVSTKTEKHSQDLKPVEENKANRTEHKSAASNESEEIEDIWANREEEVSKKAQSFWDKYAKSTMEKETESEINIESTISKTKEEVVDIWGDQEAQVDIAKPKFSFWDKEEKTKEIMEVVDTPQEEVKKPKFSFWNNCSTPTVVKEKEPAKTITKEKEVASDIWADRVEDLSKICSTPTVVKEKEPTNTITKPIKVKPDIWADRVEDLPPKKPIKPKQNSTLESAKDSFWSSVADANKTSQTSVPVEIRPESKKKQKKSKSLRKKETATKMTVNLIVLKSVVTDMLSPQIASIHYEKETITETHCNTNQQQEDDEVDFWATIENDRQSKTPEPQQTAIESSVMASFGENETRFWNDEEEQLNAQTQFDRFNYPAEPREVDTDEEIDFWAEIEAKRHSDDVTFNKSASFWASRDRKNSVDETPYKPVLKKAFNARLPDEPAAENIDIWAALEAHKGEEPVIVDPEMEKEQVLVEEYDKMVDDETEEEEEDDEEEDCYTETASVHEPVVASMWSPPMPQALEVPQTDYKTEVENVQQTEMEEESNEIKPVKDELEMKRSNYKKAMAFFTTSVDDHKDQTSEKYERSQKSMNRNSYIEEENDKWDWDAVNEAIQQESKDATPEVTETNKPETFVKESSVKSITPPKAVAPEPALPELYVEPTLTLKRLPNGLPDLEVNKFNEQRKISVKDRISVFETVSTDSPSPESSRRPSIKNQSLSVESYTRQSSLSRNSSTQRSESEMDEDDSGVTDMNKHLSETDTESESFPELKKMSSYQRAATHSRLFKLLQDDTEILDESKGDSQNADEFQLRPSRRKVVHNVSITRKQNPKSLAEAETMTQRRERLSLPLRKNTSIDADNPSTPNSPGSPIMGHSTNQTVVSDKLVSELVQSLLLKSDSTHFKNLPMEKLQAAAKRVLEEELDSLDNTSVDSTPAITPNDAKKDKSYAEYYNTWSDASGTEEVVPSKSFRALQETRRTPWTARCPRVLSSKTINRDLARVTESPEISMRTSKSPECFRQSRENSVGKWRKV